MRKFVMVLATALGAASQLHAQRAGTFEVGVFPTVAYFDRTLPRSAPQVLTVTGFARCLTAESLADTTRGGCVINRELLASLDWNAVREWLDR